MRPKSASAQSSAAFAFSTSGTRAGSNAWPAERPSRASSCAALASASRSEASTSVADRRTSTAPAATRVPRSTGVPTMRPPTSAATSAFSSASSDPVTRRKRSIDWLCTEATWTATGAGSGGAAALVRSPLHAAEKSAARAAPASTGTRKLRIMTLVLGIGIQANRLRKSAASAGAQTEQHGFDRGAREGVAVLAGAEAIAEAQRRRAVRGGVQQPEDRVRRRSGRAGAGFDRALDAHDHVVLHLADEAEALPVIADARHAAVEEHQREVLGVLLAELVVAPEDFAERVGGIRRRVRLDAVGVREEQPES